MGKRINRVFITWCVWYHDDVIFCCFCLFYVHVHLHVVCYMCICFSNTVVTPAAVCIVLFNKKNAIQLPLLPVLPSFFSSQSTLLSLFAMPAISFHTPTTTTACSFIPLFLRCLLGTRRGLCGYTWQLGGGCVAMPSNDMSATCIALRTHWGTSPCVCVWWGC